MDTRVIQPVDLSGQVIGSYHITSKLGRGGMADVYKALHTELKVYRAIKFIRPEFVTSEDFVTRFQKEAQAVAGLEHPNIVRIHDFGNSNTRFFMVMQFVDGPDLKHHLAATGEFPAEQAIDMVLPIADALSYAHERDLIHRDIKPENIMLGTNNEPILMDFGIAKLLTESTALTQTGVGIGTPAYMAPEQAQGFTITPATDIYALSVVLYELVTGRQPYSADTPIAVMLKAISDPLPLPRDINPNITEALQAVILKGTAKDPAARYQHAGEFAADLIEVRGGSAPSIARQSPVLPTTKAPTTKASTTKEPTAAESPASTRSAAAKAGIKMVQGLAWLGGVVVLVLVGTAFWWWNSDNTADAPKPSALTTAKTPIGGEGGVVYEYRDTLIPGEVVETTLSLTGNEALYLQMHSSQRTADITLMQPDERKPLFKTSNTAGPFFAKEAGDHRLTIKLRGQEPGALDLQIYRVNPAIKNAGAIKLDEYTSGSTEWPGQKISYQVELEQGDTVYLEMLEATNTTDFALRSLDNRKDLFSSYRHSGPHTVKNGGTYTFLADPRADKLTDFEFILHRLNPATIVGGEFNAGEWVAGATAQPGQTTDYTVELQENSAIYLEVKRASATTDFVLQSPDGRQPLMSSYNNSGPHPVELGGTYQLRADPRSNKVTDYEFILHQLEVPVINGGQLTLEQTVNARTTQPGQIAQYELNLTETDTIALQVLSTSSTTDFTLKTADGRKNIFKSFKSVAAQTLQPGNYYLTVDPRHSKISDFEFRVTRRLEED